eukprot:gene6005-12107_t
MKAIAIFTIITSLLHTSNAFSGLGSIWNIRKHATTPSLVNSFRTKLTLKMGLFDGLKKIVGVTDTTEALVMENENTLKDYMKIVTKINNLEDSFEKLSNDELQAKTDEFRKRLRSGETLNSLLVEAFAVAREASWRVLKLRHFDVQLVGGMALNDGRLAEMATGEGKTLVAILPTYLNALTGESAFVVTTNDYLARRDGENMGQVFRFLGLTVGVIQSYQKEAERKAAYGCDVTYVSNQELGFDFLRDNLAISLDQVVQTRPYNFCVVDEADSILIDEARTPLIISRKGPAANEKYISSAEIVKSLNKGIHYDVNLKDQKVELTPAGFKFAEQIVGKGLFELLDPWAFFIVNALKAKELYNKDKEYIVRDGQVAIVDAFTGRVLDGRRFTDGLQQSIEAKESLPVSSDTQTVAKVTYQSLFRLFPKLSGMSGTAFTEAAELRDTYQLKVLPIPTALPIARRDNPDAVFRTKAGKMKALLKNVLTNHEKGRPVLIGTTSVETSEEMAQALKDLGIDVKVLNARPESVERESEIVAQAGRVGAVTVATNMAGRGTDILLGGSAKGITTAIAKNLILVSLGLLELPPVSVSVTETETVQVTESMTASKENAVDVDVDADGQSITVEEEVEEIETDPDVLALPSVSALCDYLSIALPVNLKPATELALKRAVVSCVDDLSAGAKRLDVEDMVAKGSDSMPTSDPTVRRLRTAMNTVINELETVLTREKEQVRSLGGLYVVGTARHDSRRIDNQLRGRAGRQGDLGASRFFLSLEDDIFRIFGGDKMSGLMENFRVAEDMPLESELVVQALDKVQVQVEEYMRANRQQVYKLDEVVAGQRAAVYSQRRAFLTSTDEGMLETFTRFATKTMEEIYEACLTPPAKGKGVPGGPVDADKLVAKAKQFYANIQLTPQEIAATPTNRVQQLLQQRLMDAIANKQATVDSLFASGTGPMAAGSFVAFFRYLAMIQ